MCRGYQQKNYFRDPDDKLLRALKISPDLLLRPEGCPRIQKIYAKTLDPEDMPRGVGTDVIKT